MAFNQKSLTVNIELKRNPHVTEYSLKRWGLKRFLASYLTTSVKIKNEYDLRSLNVIR